MRLNGWHRLFILLAAAYALTVGVGALLLAPSAPHRFTAGQRGWPPSRIWAAARGRGETVAGANLQVLMAYDTAYPRRWLVDLPKAEQQAIEANVDRMVSDSVSNDVIGDYLGRVERLRPDATRPKRDYGPFGPRIPAAVDWKRLADSLVSADGEGYRRDRERYVQTALLLWALPLVGLYLIGLGVTWVRAGFRREAPES